MFFLHQCSREFFDETFTLQSGLKALSIRNFLQLLFVGKFTHCLPTCILTAVIHLGMEEKCVTVPVKGRAVSFNVWIIFQYPDGPLAILPGHNKAAPFL